MFVGSSRSKDEATEKVPLVWVDCDPGGDDTFALMWLFALEAEGHCRVVGISTCEGNVKAHLTYACADKVTTLCKSKLQICAQSPRAARFGSKAERRKARLEAARAAEAAGGTGGASHIHGADGMGGLSNRLRSSGNPFEDAPESYEAMSDALLRFPRQIYLVCIGPLTNAADADSQQPGLLMLARDIIIMGGAFKVHGNIRPNAEFNFYHVSSANDQTQHVRRTNAHARRSLVACPGGGGDNGTKTRTPLRRSM